MAKSNDTEQLIKKATEGKFKYVSDIVEADSFILEEDDAVRIIIACCKAVCNAGQLTVNEGELCDVMLACVKFIKSPDDRLHKPYLQALYYITAFFLKRENYKCIIKLDHVLAPEFISSIKDEALLAIYNSMCCIIYKSIRELKASVPESVFMQLCTISLKMFSLHLNVIKLFTTASSYFVNPHFIKADIDLQCICYTYLFGAVHGSNIINLEKGDIYKAIIDTLSNVITNLCKQQAFGPAERFLKLGLSTLSTVCNDDAYLQLQNIICACLPEIDDFKKINSDEFVPRLKTSFQDLNRLFSNKKYLYQLQPAFNLINCIFQQFLECSKELDSNMWSTFMPEIIQVEVFKLLELIAETASGITMKCSSCSNCNVNKKLHVSINFCLLIANLLKAFIDKETVPLETTLHTLVLKSIQKCCKQIIILKKLGCELWRTTWLRARVNIFNLFVKLYDQDKLSYASYGCVLVITTLYLENNVKPIIEPEIVCKTLSCLSQAFCDNSKFEIASTFCALSIFYSNDLQHTSFSQWVQIKFHSKDVMKHLTVVDVLTKKTDIIKRFFPTLKVEISNRLKANILLRELSQYKEKWPSRVAMGAVVKQLYNIVDSVTLIANIVVQTWSDTPLDNEDVIELIPRIIHRLNSEKETVEVNICLALLYIMQYNIKLHQLQNKLEESINNEKAPRTVDASPNERTKTTSDNYNCIIIPNIDLNLEQYYRLSSNLNSALRLIQCCSLNPQYIEDYKLDETFENVALEFEKHGDSVRALHSWFVCRRLSELIDNKLFLLKSGSFILKHSNMDSDDIKLLLKDCDDLVLTITSSVEPQVMEILCVYSMNKSIMLLRNHLVEDSFKEYQTAVQFYTRIPDEMKNSVLKMQLDFLNIQHLFLPCDVAPENHGDYALAKFFLVLKDVISHVKLNGGPTAIILLLEAYEFVIRMYKWMNISRELRCYCRGILTFAQKQYLLPRIVSIITYMTYADIISLRFDDARTKLTYLAELLNLNEPSKYNNDNCIALQDLIDNFSKISLTCGSNNSINGSPGLVRKLKVVPGYLFHKNDCICDYCISVEYKQLVLVYYTLEAQLYVYSDNTSESTVLRFEAGLKFYQFITSSQSELEAKMSKILNRYSTIDLHNNFLEAYGTLLLRYGNELLRLQNVSKATSVNTDLVNLMNHYKRTNAYLYNEALAQSINILLASTEVARSSDIQTTLTVSGDFTTAFTTPVNKKTKSIQNKSSSVRFNPPPERYLRKVKFTYSPEQAPPVKGHKPTFVSSINRTPMPCKLRDDEPLQEVTINVPYMSSALSNKTKPKKPVLKEIGNVDDDSKNDGVIPSSPNAYTPNAKKVDTALKVRTRLLTQKLQKSSVKIVTNDGNNENSSGQTNFRKNLLQELSNDSEELCKGERARGIAVRKKVIKMKVDLPSKTVTRSRNAKK